MIDDTTPQQSDSEWQFLRKILLRLNAGVFSPALNNPAGVKVYRALLSQLGTADPTVVVLENSIGAIVWTRNSTGVYYGTLIGAFTLHKTWTNIGWTANDSLSVGNEVDQFIIAKRAAGAFSQDRIVVQSVRVDLSSPGTGGVIDSLLSETPIEILVYP